MSIQTKFKKLKFVYLASPYSHKDKRIREKRYLDITRIAAELTILYEIAFFCPITQSAALARAYPEALMGGTFDAWRDIDLTIISHADEIWVATLDGWKQSVGVLAEIAYAKERKIPIKYYDPIKKAFIKTKRGL